jgi:hypothetical protein
VERIIERVPGVRRSTEPSTFVLTDPAGGTVDVALGLEGETVRDVEVVAEHSDDAPQAMWSFCAAVADALGWKVYDPQGDAWYTPDQLARASHGTAVKGDGVLLLAGGAIAIVAGAVWAIRGKQQDVWLWATAVGVLMVAVGRIWQRLAGRD